MKRTLFILVASVLFSISTFSNSPIVFSGSDENNQVLLGKDSILSVDTVKSRITSDGSNFNFAFSWKKKNRLEPHWSGMGMAIANFNGDLGADLKLSQSYSFVFNPIEYFVPLNNHFLLVSGVGVDWSRYHFKGNVGLKEVDGITQFVPAPEGINYKSSKLLAYYFTVPVFLEYQTRITRKHDFHVSGGVVGYIKCYSKSQIDYEQSGSTIKETLGRDLNILPVNARAMAHIGFGEVTLYGYYSLFSMFDKGKGPDVRPVGIGVVLDF